ncbi:toll/interleukin-1 receptor domain-containing protein [Streptomyces sp. JNUCC 64]
MPKVFLSWSGEPSRVCAEALHNWLKYFNTAIEPFVSSADIRKGDRGLQRIAEQLEGSSFGVVCVTPGNLTAPWINFESGALSRQVSEGKVIPFLLGVTVAELVGSPLAQFQAVNANSPADVLEMVRAINARCEPAAAEQTVTHLFQRLWPELEQTLQEVDLTAGAAAPVEAAPAAPTEAVLNELLVLIREQVNRITDLERAVGALRSGVHAADRRGVPFGDLYDSGASSLRLLAENQVPRLLSPESPPRAEPREDGPDSPDRRR